MSKGFTLLELLLYMTLVAMMVMTLTPMAWDAIQGEAKVMTQAEVYTQARYVSERLKYEIRNATGINSVTANSVSLAVIDGSKNPTVIDLTGGKVRIKWGAATAVDINSSDTNVSSLTFTNYTSGDSKTEHVGFVLTMTDNLASVRQEYAESVSVRGSAEVRGN